MQDKYNSENFSINLRHLCGFYSSISEVCRRLEINRQQFNRYLNGKSFPSFKNLKRICDFFGVDSEEIIEPTHLFKNRVSPIAQQGSQQAIPENLAKIIMPLLTKTSKDMERYEGYYYRYFYSFGFPGFIFRSFVKIYRINDVCYMKHIERSSGKDPLLGARLTIKYHGLVFLLADRLFIVESEPELDSTISETILTPSYRPNNPYLSGLMVCAASGGAHQPGSARTVFEYLGKNINLRAAMKKCDLYHHTDTSIPKNIKQAITNVITPEEFTFTPPRN